MSDDGLPKLRALSEAMRLERETSVRNAAMVCGVALGFVVGFVIVALIPALWNWSLVIPLLVAVLGAYVGHTYLSRWLLWRAHRAIARRSRNGGRNHS